MFALHCLLVELELRQRNMNTLPNAYLQTHLPSKKHQDLMRARSSPQLLRYKQVRKLKFVVYLECHPQGKSKHVFKLFVYLLITLIKGNTCGWIRLAVIISPKASKNHLCKKQSWSYEIEVRSVDLSIECRLVSIKWNVLYLTPFAHKYTHTHIQ